MSEWDREKSSARDAYDGPDFEGHWKNMKASVLSEFEEAKAAADDRDGASFRAGVASALDEGENDGEDENGFDDDGEDDSFNPRPHGDWAETIVKVDRTQKVTKGGTIMTYRCLIITGNGKGAGGFGMGKGQR